MKFFLILKVVPYGQPLFFLRTFKVTLFYIREILLLPKINRTKVIILDTSSPYTFS
jgi:hypothetical protein